jgi:4-hydroxy-tetrahydrodipicolinate synthase
MAQNLFEGSLVAIVTPFEGGEIHEKQLRDLVEWHISEGTDGIVPCGTTGESATMNHEEHGRVIKIVADQAKGRVKILAGTGSNATSEAIKLTQHAKEVGADGALLVSPYYNKPTQEGLYRHYKAVADSVDLPIVLYNVPSRTAVNILPETTARLSKISNIVAIKEASGDLKQIKKVAELCEKNFTILSGEDAQNFQILELGGSGMISVTANVVPSKMAKIWDLFKAGDVADAKAVHEELMPLHKALFLETNPIPVKTAVALMGKCREEWRLPLCEMGKEAKKELTEVLKKFQLI